MKTPALSTILIISFLHAFTGCSGGLNQSPPIDVVRYVKGYPSTVSQVLIVDGRPVGPVGTDIGTFLGYTTYIPGAPDSINGKDEIVSKVEIDWGDGAGFQDYTQDAYHKWKLLGTSEDPQYLSRHTYQSAGDYTITGRITYWDGIVVTETEGDRAHIRIAENPRFVLGFSYGVSELSFDKGVAVGPAGTEIGMSLLYLRNIPGAPVSVFGKDGIISKAEIDWGDGGGFQDYTQDAYDKWDIGGGGDDPQYLSHHTYTIPGEYTMIGRLTYWDGTVVTEEESDRATIRITP